MSAYGFTDMYFGGFYPYRGPEQFWGFWCRYICINRYQKTPKPTYEKLLRLLEGKDHFVITANVDHCFQKAGIDRAYERKLIQDIAFCFSAFFLNKSAV